MSLPSTPLKGSISFSSNIQNVYGGTNPINLSEYYFNSSSNYVIGTGGTNIPVIGPISISKFYGKTSLLSNPWEAMIDVVRYGLTYYYGNITSPNLDNTNNQFASIGTVGFDFYWFGINYGINNNIFWSTNNAITFGTGIAINTPWTATTAKGVLIGQANRYTIQIRQYPPEDDVTNELIYKHKIKQLYVEASDTAGNANPPIKMEISLIRGRIYQYIEIIVINWDIGGGIWNISDGSIFYNPFISSTNPPIGTNRSVVLRGNLNGTDWVAFNDYSMMKLGQNGPYVNYLTLGISLQTFIFLIFDANAMTEYGNDYIKQGDKISLWYRSRNSTNNNNATQSILSRQPIYNTTSVLFSDGNVLVSTLGLYNHIQVNIFVVWRKTASSSTKRWLWSHDVTDTATDTKRSLIINGDNSILVGRGGGTPLTVNYTFPLYITNVVNCEYNSAGNTGKFYINNVLRNTFINVDSTGTTEMSIGSFNNGTTINSSSSINGIIYEIFCTRNVLTDIDRTKIFKYLNVKWGPFYEDAITSMGENLVFRLDGNNIDGAKNYLLNEGGAISSWYNSGNQAGLTTTQTDAAKRPTYNLKGGCIFNGTQLLVSNVDLSSYPNVNIFFVWSNSIINSQGYTTLWNQNINNLRKVQIFFQSIGSIIFGSEAFSQLLYQVPLNTTVIVNCEYNMQNTGTGTGGTGTGKAYINNNLKLSNIRSVTPTGATQTFFGAETLAGNNGLKGIIYEIIVIKTTLTDTQRTNIYNCLETKWGPTLYNDAITSMGNNLVYRVDGTNLDGIDNKTLPVGSKIGNFYNSGNNYNKVSNFASTTQSDDVKKPIFIGNGALFNDGNKIVSNVQLKYYPQMNIFVVWKKMQTSTTNRWLWSEEYGTNPNTGAVYINRSLYISSDTSVTIGFGTNSLLTITYTFPLYATTVVNCEYNTVGTNGKFYINNLLLGSCINADFTTYAYTTTSYGGSYTNNNDASLNGIIYEIIIINRLLSDDERTNIYNSLNVKWGPFYTDAITSIGNNLVLRLDGYNIDGIKNSRLTSGSKISSWFNSGNTYSLTTSQSTLALQPTYNTNSVEFLNNSTTVLVSNINFNNYPIMNIFLVWKKTADVPASGANYLWANNDATYKRSAWISNKYLYISKGSTNDALPYTFTIGKTYVINCEYNTASSKMYIQNILVNSFSFTNSSDISSSIVTYFGNINASAPIASTIKGIFYEIIIINGTLTNTQRENIYNCLDNKWNTDFPDAITKMGSNLIFRLNGNNIDGTNNSTLTSGTSTISSWFNSGFTTTIFTQPIVYTGIDYAIYNMNSATLLRNDTTYTELASDINLTNYQRMNIFIVFKLAPSAFDWRVDLDLWNNGIDVERVLKIYRNSYFIGFGYGQSQSETYTFNFDTFYVVNCEYNSNGENGYFYINNNLHSNFICVTVEPTHTEEWYTKTWLASMNGTVYEIIIIDKILSDDERTNIYNNLIASRWQLFDISSMMGINLVFRLDGKNIDGTNNSTLTSGTSTISSWFNSGNVASLTTTQTVVAKRPTYTNNSVVFNYVNGLDCSMNLFNYQIMNVIIVLSLTAMPITVTNYNNFANAWALWVNQDAGRLILISNGKIHIGKGYGTGNFSNDIVSIDKTSLLNTIEIYHIEYNIVSNPGKFYINNILQISFTTLNAINPSYTGTQQPSIGYRSNYYYLKGIIYEVLIINRLLTDTERTIIYNLLKTKWNVP